MPMNFRRIAGTGDGRSVLTTGGNSGIGLAAALTVARRGFRSVAGVRSAEKAEIVARAANRAGVSVETVLLDVTDARACAAVIEEVRPWALVNNAGLAATGAIEDVTDDDARRAFETMVLAPMRLARLALPHMRTRGEGRIVNVSSIFGRTTLPVNGWYQGCKHALEALSDGLRMEVARDGVRVILVEPGCFGTGIWNAARDEFERRAESRYARAYERAIRAMRVTQPFLGNPERAGAAIALALTARAPRARYLVGFDARVVALLDPVTHHAAGDRIRRLPFGL